MVDHPHKAEGTRFDGNLRAEAVEVAGTDEVVKKALALRFVGKAAGGSNARLIGVVSVRSESVRSDFLDGVAEVRMGVEQVIPQRWGTG